MEARRTFVLKILRVDEKLLKERGKRESRIDAG